MRTFFDHLQEPGISNRRSPCEENAFNYVYTQISELQKLLIKADQFEDKMTHIENSKQVTNFYASRVEKLTSIFYSDKKQ